MKPRPEAPLTDEDCGIWLLVTFRLYARAGSPKSLPISFAPGCDRRDADLMLKAMKDRGVSVLVKEWGPRLQKYRYWQFPARRMRWHQ